MWRIVGNGKVTNENCGKFRGFRGCIRTDLHDVVTLAGESYHGKAYVCVKHFSCFKPDCPVCYLSWALREAKAIAGRLDGLRKFGLAEHIVVSVPLKDYGLGFEKLRAKVVKVCKDRGIKGGVMIFHGFRYDVRRHWCWSPHFHVLDFVEGGVHGCRECQAVGSKLCFDKGGFCKVFWSLCKLF